MSEHQSLQEKYNLAHEVAKDYSYRCGQLQSQVEYLERMLKVARIALNEVLNESGSSTKSWAIANKALEKTGG